LKNGLNQARNYLKNNYKMHVQNNSEIGDHCATFALSDPLNPNWAIKCDHSHELECNQCLVLKNLLKELRSDLERCNMNDSLRARYLYRVDYNEHLILDWKAHLMRSIQQDFAKIDILESLQSDSVFMLMDWAMKWLPMKYREAQRDFFGN
jgi:6-phosphogluconate dehydrogenase